MNFKHKGKSYLSVDNGNLKIHVNIKDAGLFFRMCTFELVSCNSPIILHHAEHLHSKVEIKAPGIFASSISPVPR